MTAVSMAKATAWMSIAPTRVTARTQDGKTLYFCPECWKRVEQAMAVRA
jgi:hypothetical protein